MDERSNVNRLDVEISTTCLEAPQAERVIDKSCQAAAFSKQALRVQLALFVCDVTRCDELGEAQYVRQGGTQGLAPE